MFFYIFSFSGFCLFLGVRMLGQRLALLFAIFNMHFRIVYWLFFSFLNLWKVQRSLLSFLFLAFVFLWTILLLIWFFLLSERWFTLRIFTFFGGFVFPLGAHGVWAGRLRGRFPRRLGMGLRLFLHPGGGLRTLACFLWFWLPRAPWGRLCWLWWSRSLSLRFSVLILRLSHLWLRDCLLVLNVSRMNWLWLLIAFINFRLLDVFCDEFAVNISVFIISKLTVGLRITIIDFGCAFPLRVSFCEKLCEFDERIRSFQSFLSWEELL